MSSFTCHTFAECPERAAEADALCGPAWPEFMLHDPVSDNWDYLMNDFAAFQFFLCDAQERIVAVGNTIPLKWDAAMEDLPDRGWDAAFEGGIADLKAGRVPNILSALQAVVVADQKGKGISGAIVGRMRSMAKQHGLSRLVAPVRPSWKCRYPLIPMARYVTWQTADGLPFDPWLRVHARMGARFVKVARRSMQIGGSVAEWERWTEMRFPQSGKYIVPGALNPVTIQIEKDRGVYVEPNVWMVHEVASCEA
ncbi:MAG: GNAT family N-acetyltransferase [Chloroflexota bacterium]